MGVESSTGRCLSTMKSHSVTLHTTYLKISDATGGLVNVGIIESKGKLQQSSSKYIENFQFTVDPPLPPLIQYCIKSAISYFYFHLTVQGCMKLLIHYKLRQL